MAQLVFRSSGRKIKRNLTTQEKILQAIGMKPKEVRRESKWLDLQMQVAKLNSNQTR